MNCAPPFDIVRKSLSPCLSINVTSLRSTTHFRFPSVRWVSFQLLLSSLTHNPTKRPCKVHFSSTGVSVLVIFNTSISLIWESVRFSAAVVDFGCYRVRRRLPLSGLSSTRWHMFARRFRCVAVICGLSEFECFFLMRHNDGYFIARSTAAADVYFCFRICLIAVHDGISESLAERQLDVAFRSPNTLRSFNQPHQAPCRLWYGVNLVRHPGVDFHDARMRAFS